MYCYVATDEYGFPELHRYGKDFREEKIAGDLHSDFLALMRSRSSVADLGNRSVKLFDIFFMKKILKWKWRE